MPRTAWREMPIFNHTFPILHVLRLMITFFVRRLAYSCIVLYGVVTVTFFLMFVLPGDPARLMLGQRADVASVAAIRRQLGLDQPLVVQYYKFATDLLPVDVIAKSTFEYKSYT